MTLPPTASGNDSIALRAFAILEQVARAPVPQSLDDVTQAMGLPKPTVYRILNMLHASGLLLREQGTKRYSAGPRLIAFAIDLWRNRALRAPWRRALEVAVGVIGESCNLTVLQDNQVLYLDRVETSHPLRLHLETGTRVPLHCTASGKLFLSQMPVEQARAVLGPEPYTAYSRHTLTTFKDLEPELQRVRKSMMATHNSEFFADSVALAVPVLDPAGKFFAAVAVHAPASRMSLKRMTSECVEPLREAARTIASTLVGDPGALTAEPSTPALARPAPVSARSSGAPREARAARATPLRTKAEGRKSPSR
jgi:DNA-binding IclR family transcriptional regulator